MSEINQMIIVRDKSVNSGNGLVYIKFKKNRLPRKQKKIEVKKGNRYFLKLIAGNNFISYSGQCGWENFFKKPSS